MLFAAVHESLRGTKRNSAGGSIACPESRGQRTRIGDRRRLPQRAALDPEPTSISQCNGVGAPLSREGLQPSTSRIGAQSPRHPPPRTQESNVVRPGLPYVGRAVSQDVLQTGHKVGLRLDELVPNSVAHQLSGRRELELAHHGCPVRLDGFDADVEEVSNLLV